MAKPSKKSKFSEKGMTPIFVTIVALALLAGAITLTIFLNAFKTETYYVLNSNVPAQTLVTPDMMKEVITNEGGTPHNAISISDIQKEVVWTKYPLSANDIVSTSAVYPYSDEDEEDGIVSTSTIEKKMGIAVGVPDSWVITSFTVDATNATGGRIERGTYFDIMVISDQGAFYPFVNVLALETGNGTGETVTDEEGNTTSAGPTTEYTVGMSPADAAKLQDTISRYGKDNVRLTISPRQNDYAAPRLADYDGVFSHNPEDGATNGGKGTDYTFTDVERDKHGRPLEQIKDNTQGNSRVPAKGAPESAQEKAPQDSDEEIQPSDGGE